MGSNYILYINFISYLVFAALSPLTFAAVEYSVKSIQRLARVLREIAKRFNGDLGILKNTYKGFI